MWLNTRKFSVKSVWLIKTYYCIYKSIVRKQNHGPTAFHLFMRETELCAFK